MASLTAVLEAYPTICATGFGISNLAPAAPLAERLRQFDAARAELVADREELVLALDFLACCAPTLTPRLGSYGLKHVAEAWHYGRPERAYVSNGALICAALMLDLRPDDRRSLDLAHLGHVSPNARIGVSRRSVDQLSRSTEPRRTVRRMSRVLRFTPLPRNRPETFCKFAEGFYPRGCDTARRISTLAS